MVSGVTNKQSSPASLTETNPGSATVPSNYHNKTGHVKRQVQARQQSQPVQEPIYQADKPLTTKHQNAQRGQGTNPSQGIESLFRIGSTETKYASCQVE